jgi:GntR family transcriptional regulator/MocR family aminotransferase
VPAHASELELGGFPMAATQIPLDLDRSRREPLSEQLAQQLRDAIRGGRIPAGSRLPSSRSLAEQLGLGRNTVVRVYETLMIEGLVESRVASGVFVSSAPPGAPSLPAPRDDAQGDERSIAARQSQRPSSAALRQLEPARSRVLYDFAPGQPHPDLFPLKTWRRLLASCLSYRGSAGLTQRGEAGGLLELRAAIAAHVRLSRGLVADPEQVLIVGGTQQALSLCARAFLSPPATAVLEDPCYEGAALVFRATGARLTSVPVDQDGIVASALPDEPAALVYLTPGHQYPTGHCLAAARRSEIVAWANQHGAYIIEDDYDGDLHYDGVRAPALAVLAPERTILLGTFSTSLGRGLALAYLIVPPALAAALRREKALHGCTPPWLEQAALAELIQSGSYGAHLTRARAQYKSSRDTLLAALQRHFGKVEISGAASGTHVLWQLPAGVPEAARLEELAARQRVAVYSLAAAGAAQREPSLLARRSLVLGYTSLLPQQIDDGIARLSDAVDDTLDDHHEFVAELLLEGPPFPSRPSAGVRKPARAASSLRQPPALRTVARRRSRSQRPGEDPVVMRSVRAIYRYPIKGLSPEPLQGISLEAGKPFPFDRVFALVRPNVPVDVEAPRWAKKGLFMMLMLDDALARVHTELDVETLRFTVSTSASSTGDRPRVLLASDLSTSQGRRAVEAFFRDHVPALSGPPKLVRALDDGHFMDKPDSVISCINLATVRSLEAQWGRPVHPLRFRANFYLEGFRPWEEFDWIGSDILLGDVLFRVDRRNGRCGATNVNPETGERDMDIPGSLRKSFGHKDVGIYLVARNAGKVVVGDPVTVPDLGLSAKEEPVAALAPAGHAFICRGCYFIYDESRSAMPPFATLGDDFRCPDCGTEKANFRPYFAPALAAAPASSEAR